MKIGLGTSATLTVLLLAACAAGSPTPPRSVSVIPRGGATEWRLLLVQTEACSSPSTWRVHIPKPRLYVTEVT